MVETNNEPLGLTQVKFFFASLCFASPIIVVLIMFGAALMQNNIPMFLLYYTLISFWVAVRWGLFKLSTFWYYNRYSPETEITQCENLDYLLTPFFFGSGRNENEVSNQLNQIMNLDESSQQRLTLNLFTFFFTMTYVLMPSWFAKKINSSSLSFFIFFIIYLVYDVICRIFFVNPGCGISNYYLFRILVELILGVGFGSLSLLFVQRTGLKNMLYFQDGISTLAPPQRKRKVYKCGKINAS